MGGSRTISTLTLLLCLASQACVPSTSRWFVRDTGCPAAQVTSEVIEPGRRYVAEGCGQRAAYACMPRPEGKGFFCKAVIRPPSSPPQVVDAPAEDGQTQRMALVAVSAWTMLSVAANATTGGLTLWVHTLTPDESPGCDPMLYADDGKLELRRLGRAVEAHVDSAELGLNPEQARRLVQAEYAELRTCTERPEIPAEGLAAIAQLLPPEADSTD